MYFRRFIILNLVVTTRMFFENQRYYFVAMLTAPITLPFIPIKEKRRRYAVDLNPGIVLALS